MSHDRSNPSSVLCRLALVVVLSSMAANAGADVRTACASDMQRLCADVIPGGGRGLRCLRARHAELSELCRSELISKREAVQEDTRTFATNCQADIQRFCADSQAGLGRILTCLRRNESGLSEACRASLTRRRARSGAP